jgi:hypothetical protein
MADTLGGVSTSKKRGRDERERTEKSRGQPRKKRGEETRN